MQLSHAIGQNGNLFVCEKRVGRINSLKSHLSQNNCQSNKYNSNHKMLQLLKRISPLSIQKIQIMRILNASWSNPQILVQRF